MRMLAILKHVPDTRISVRINSDGSSIERAGVKFVCDPFDEIAIEQAVKLKSSLSEEAEVVVLMVGDDTAADTLRHGLAMGADRAVRLNYGALFPHDELRHARVCAAALKRMSSERRFNLILCGARSTDNGAGEFGPALAEFLDLSHVGSVTHLEVHKNHVRAQSRCITGGEMTLDVRLPAVVTCDRGLVEPRHPALPKVMKAKRQPIEIIEAAELIDDSRPQDALLAQLTPPIVPQACRFIEGDLEQVVRELIRVLREEARVL